MGFFNSVVATLILTAFLAPASAQALVEGEFCKLSPTISAQETDARVRDAAIKAYLADKVVVHVSGYFHLARAFVDNESAIHDIDRHVPTREIHPRTSYPVEGNVAPMMRELRKIAQRNPSRRIVLIGQSKGGAEVLQLVAENPGVFAANARQVYGFQLADAVTLNAAIGGSPLADVELERSPELTAKWRAHMTAQGFSPTWFTEFMKNWFLDSGSYGFKSLATTESVARNQVLLNRMDDAKRAILAKKLWYVTSRRTGERTSDFPFYLRMTVKFLLDHMAPNDGLVEEKNQMLPTIGTHLISLNNAGHMSLIGPQDSRACRREFMDLLLLKLAQVSAETSRITM